MSKYYLTIVFLYTTVCLRGNVLTICILPHVLCENMLRFLYQKLYWNNYIHLLICKLVWRSIVVSAPSCRSSRFDSLPGILADSNSLLRCNVEDNGALLCTPYMRTSQWGVPSLYRKSPNIIIKKRNTYKKSLKTKLN